MVFIGDALNDNTNIPKTIKCGAATPIEYTDTVWNDIRIVPGAFEFAGGSDPTLSSYSPTGTGTAFMVYKFVLDDEAYASTQMPHDYKEGTDLLFHLHWTPCDQGTAESGNKVGWKVDYSIADVNGTFPVAATADLSDTCSGEDDKHEITPSVTVSGTGLNISHMILLRIYRSDTGTDDTWTGVIAAESPALLEFDIHYEISTPGSQEELTK